MLLAARPRVLLVEHEDAALRTLARWLAPDYDVVTASDGIGGLQRATELRPDVVITAVRMPRLDGVSMVRRMKQMDGLRGVPVIFVTGLTTPEGIIAGLSAGARAYLHKPVDLDVLARKLRSALGR